MTHISEAMLSLYAGGELEAAELLRVAEHVEYCAECREKADEFRGAAAWLQSVAAEPEAVQVYTLRESVRERTRRHRGKWLWWAAASAAMVAFVFVGILWFRPVPEPVKVATRPVLPPLPHGRGSVTRLVLPKSVEHEKPVRRAKPRLTLVANNSEGMPVVRVRTSDPDVVILWVVGDGSEQEKGQ
jgi:anti-sigma factor RsiW